MSIFSAILSPLASIANSVIDKVVTDKNEAQRIKAGIATAFMAEGAAHLEAASKIIIAEANGGFLQRNWRPFTMLVFVALVVMKWMGLTDKSVSLEVELELMRLIQIGLGGYVVSRSAEKVMKLYKEK